MIHSVSDCLRPLNTFLKGSSTNTYLVAYSVGHNQINNTIEKGIEPGIPFTDNQRADILKAFKSIEEWVLFFTGKKIKFFNCNNFRDSVFYLNTYKAYKPVSTLAYAGSAMTNGHLHCNVSVNLRQKFRNSADQPSSYNYELLWVLLHEICHCLGSSHFTAIDDVPTVAELMKAYVVPSNDSSLLQWKKSKVIEEIILTLASSECKFNGDKELHALTTNVKDAGKIVIRQQDKSNAVLFLGKFIPSLIKNVE